MLNKSIVRAYAKRMGKRVTLKQAEQEIHRIACEISHNVAGYFVFGHHTREDMAQQGVVEALEVLRTDKYDPSRPLENFLQVHIRNRLSNIKRREAFRSEPPCSCCDRWEPPAQPCPRWLEWHKNNTSKQALLRTVDVYEVNLSMESIVVQEALASELREQIREHLPEDLREDYDRLLSQEKIPARRLQVLRDACTHALQEIEDGSEI